MHDSPTEQGRASLPTPGGGTASFWHQEPSPILHGHRTTKNLPSSDDVAVVIIGSGISGAFAAWHLSKSRPDADIVMLEAREACWGATGRNGGHCQPKVYSNSPHIGRFEMQNWTFLRDLVQDEGIDCEWTDVKACHAYYDEELFYPAVAAVEALKVLDPDLGQLVHVVTKRSMESTLQDLKSNEETAGTGTGFTRPTMRSLRLSEDAVGAVVTDSAASLWPYKLVAWVLESLLKKNRGKPQSEKKRSSLHFNLQTTTPVTRLQKAERDGWIVHTPRGMISAKQVLVATNAYTSFLLPQFKDLIVPVKEEMTALKPPAALSPSFGIPLQSRNSYCFYSSSEEEIMKDDYLIQRPFATDTSKKERGGELMFGGGREFAKDSGVGISDDSFIEKRPAEYLQAALSQELDLKNGGGSLEAECIWSGIMGFSRDWHPWVGRIPDELGGGRGLFMCAGFSGHGMPNASLCAKAAVKAMIGYELGDDDLPKEYVVSTARAQAAMRLLNVK